MLNRFLKSTLILPLLLQTSISYAIDSNKTLELGNQDTKNAKDFSVKALNSSNKNSQIHNSAINVSQEAIFATLDFNPFYTFNIKNSANFLYHSNHQNYNVTSFNDYYIPLSFSNTTLPHDGLINNHTQHTIYEKYFNNPSIYHHQQFYLLTILYFIVFSLILFNSKFLTTTSLNTQWKKTLFVKNQLIHQIISSYKNKVLFIYSKSLRKKIFSSQNHLQIILRLSH